ncbi:MAG: hypothetical protein DWQ34_22865 [Planctomycetota bacterium]|nr:MAG: hypothetical protein DWQ34_22865 [Planctomycetota bacterium]REJ88224.1 MAG: hypothetical protein DWQ29_08605 [Planctomycetota bacterium]REK24493.1 MAG: hypothetical protein DWQ41_15900 [Planctomycetota bacterium]REK32454.1 MAG: hypothetical protein DWQ45_17035 [Planctomycetota bacterium]
MTGLEPRKETIDQGHEGVSLRPRHVIIATTGLVVIIVASLFIVAGLDRFLSADRPAAAPLEREPGAPPRGTPLEPNQKQRKLEYLAEQQELLHGYGWVDREQGVARIPIDEAMRLYVEQNEVAE